MCLLQSIFTKSKTFLLSDTYTETVNANYITYKSHDGSLCDSASLCTFTTSLHTPFTLVPELGAIWTIALRTGTKQAYSYTGSDDSDWLVSV